MSIRQRCWSVS